MEWSKNKTKWEPHGVVKNKGKPHIVAKPKGNHTEWLENQMEPHKVVKTNRTLTGNRGRANNLCISTC